MSKYLAAFLVGSTFRPLKIVSAHKFFDEAAGAALAYNVAMIPSHHKFVVDLVQNSVRNLDGTDAGWAGVPPWELAAE